VDVEVVHAAAARDHRDPRRALAVVDQARAAARDQEVDRVVAAQELSQLVAIRVAEDVHHPGREPGGCERLAQHVAEHGDADLGNQQFDGSTIDDTVKGMAGTLGENIQLGRVVRFETDDGFLDGYKHIQNERGVIGVLVEVGGVDGKDARAQEVAHDIALHIANSAPRYTRREDVPPDEVDRERAVLEAQTRQEGKPEQALAKIVEGKLNAFYKDNVLADQPFVKDDSKSIGQLTDEMSAKVGEKIAVRRFARFELGEEIA
jgi:elongation factor Ts